jgi:hypothetical protein
VHRRVPCATRGGRWGVPASIANDVNIKNSLECFACASVTGPGGVPSRVLVKERVADPQRRVRPALEVGCRLERIPDFYIWNFVVRACVRRGRFWWHAAQMMIMMRLTRWVA